MEVRGNQPDGSATPRERFEEQRQRLAEGSRARSQEARYALTELTQRNQAKHANARAAAVSRQAQQADAKAASKRTERSIASKQDRVELSAAARQHRDDIETRAEQVAQLAELHQQGQLNTPERIERAAESLLGS